MKKILSYFGILIVLFFFTSCGIIDSDSHIARDKMLNLVNLIENNKYTDIKNNFSNNIVKEVENIDEKIVELCNYYNGEYDSIVCNGLGSYGPVENGKSIKYFEMFYDIITTTDSYHFSILWYIIDDYEADNIGIWSINLEKSVGGNPQTSIDTWVNGINIIYKKDL